MFEPITHKTRFVLRPDARPVENGRWVWPLPKLGGCTPQVIRDTGDERCGVELGYERKDFGGPLFVPVYAAQSGHISFAAQAVTGYAVSLDHGGKWSTHYAHLEHMFATPTNGGRRRRAHVRAGDVVGYAARSPVHVRFELWEWTDEDGFVPVSPASRMSDWLLLPQFDEPRPTHQTHTEQAAA